MLSLTQHSITSPGGTLSQDNQQNKQTYEHTYIHTYIRNKI